MKIIDISSTAYYNILLLLFFADPACQEINTHYGCYVMEPSCQPREAKKENDVAVLYSCLGVFVAVIIVVAILLYLKWKSKSKCRKGMY